MTPEAVARKAKLESLLERVRVNRARFGHPSALPGPAVPEEADEEPVTLQASPAPSPVVPLPPPPSSARPPVAPPPSSASSLPLPPPASAPAPLPPLDEVEPPEPPEEPMVWEAEDEEDEYLLEDEASGADEGAAMEIDVEPSVEEPAPPPPLPTTTVSPKAPTPAAPEPAAAAPVQAAPVAPHRVDSLPPAEGAVVRTLGEVAAEVPRTIGDLLRAAVRLGGTG